MKKIFLAGVEASYDEKLNEWELRLPDGYRRSVDGDLDKETLNRIAVDLVKTRQRQAELYPRRGYAHFS